MQHFLTVTDFDNAGFAELIQLTAEVKKDPSTFSRVLNGRDIALLFMKASTRTRVSFEVGINQLGGRPLVLSSRDMQLGRGETVADTARVLSRYVDAIMARVFGHEVLTELAEWGSVPIVNGLSDRVHPCQALCDYFTMQEHFGTLDGLDFCYVGDGNNMAHSLMLAGAMLGVNVTIVAPEGYQPLAEIAQQAEEIGRSTGSAVRITDDPRAGVEGANVVYTDVWASMGQEAEQQERLRAFAGFQVDGTLFGLAEPEAIFMHCLPAHRGEEVSAEVADHARSVIFDQAENRLHTQKALLIRLLG